MSLSTQISNREMTRRAQRIKEAEREGHVTHGYDSQVFATHNMYLPSRQ
jgi:hypothetical protein